MPFYEYRCKDCKKEEEVFTKTMNDEKTKECPKCGSLMERIISSHVGVIFKGPGFFANDKKLHSDRDPKRPQPVKEFMEKEGI